MVVAADSCLSIAWNELCHPVLSAGTRSARSSCSRECPGKYNKRIHVSNRDPFRAISDLYDLIVRAYLSFL